MKTFSKVGLLQLALMAFAPAHAFADPLIDGAKLCTKHLPRYEREYAIPTHLLSAIASTESGRYHDGLKLKLPWPWTINAEGKSYYYNSKEEAISAVHKLRSHGVQSIDVGCMQVNLYHHPHAFSSLDKAFDPENNIAYAASFLRDLYNEEGTWKKAAADYHSRTPELGRQYVDLVYDGWFTIIERLRAARLAVPESSVAGMQELKTASNTVPSSTSHNMKVVKVAPLPEQQGRKVAAYTHPHMNHIEVSDSAAKNTAVASVSAKPSDMLVVKPEIKPEMVTADSTPLQISAPLSVVSSAVAATVDTKAIPASAPAPAASATPPTHKPGPNFIFND